MSITTTTKIKIERVIFGVRFQPRYELIDNMGAVIDKVLRTPGTPYGPEIFPLSTREPGEQILLNPDTRDQFQLTERDAILNMHLTNNEIDEVKTSAYQYSKYILTNLREIAKLKDIVRYGVVFQLEECQSKLSESPANYFLKDDFQEIRSLNLNFSRRLAALEALSRKGVDDFRNVIYTIKQTEEGEVTISVDYQEYFKPGLNSDEWLHKPFTDFVDRGISHLQGEFHSWLTKLLTQSTEAINVVRKK